MRLKFLLSLLLAGCNSVTLESNALHYQERAVQVMHVTRDQAFGDEHNTYSTLYQAWREENAEQRQQAYYQKCLAGLRSQEPVQRLSPVGSNSPAAGSDPLAEEIAAALPEGTL